MRNYPKTVSEVLSRRKKYRPAALAAVRRFARSKPWQGSVAERRRKLAKLNRELAAAYGVPRPALRFDAAVDCYVRLTGTIQLTKMAGSVVTYLHEFAHHLLGPCERRACRWSLNLFRRCFPRSFRRLQQVGHTLVRPPKNSAKHPCTRRHRGA